MNAKRRKALEKAAGMISDARSIIDEVRQEEEAVFDSRSDRWKDSEPGEKAGEQIYTLESIVTDLEDAEEALEDITGAGSEGSAEGGSHD